MRDAVTGRVIDRVPGQMDVYCAVTGTGSNRLFFLADRSSRERPRSVNRRSARFRPAGPSASGSVTRDGG